VSVEAPVALTVSFPEKDGKSKREFPGLLASCACAEVEMASSPDLKKTGVSV
jgi:hypothetical protein